MQAQRRHGTCKPCGAQTAAVARLISKMAAKVGLLAEDQDNSAIPAERVRRNVAEYLVRKLLAVQVSKYLFKRLKVNSARLQAIPEQLPKKPYIPHEYQHHIEPKLHRVDRRQMEELERWYAACCL